MWVLQILAVHLGEAGGLRCPGEAECAAEFILVGVSRGKGLFVSHVVRDRVHGPLRENHLPQGIVVVVGFNRNVPQLGGNAFRPVWVVDCAVVDCVLFVFVVVDVVGTSGLVAEK